MIMMLIGDKLMDNLTQEFLKSIEPAEPAVNSLELAKKMEAIPGVQRLG